MHEDGASEDERSDISTPLSLSSLLKIAQVESIAAFKVPSQFENDSDRSREDPIVEDIRIAIGKDSAPSAQAKLESGLSARYVSVHSRRWP